MACEGMLGTGQKFAQFTNSYDTRLVFFNCFFFVHNELQKPN